MKMAQKIARIVEAYELGMNSTMEKLLISEGTIQILEDGKYRLRSLEAKSKGELCNRGDFFKVNEENGAHFAYPIKREKFLATHKFLGGNQYEQITKPVKVWQVGDKLTYEIKYLQKIGKLIIDKKDDQQYFNAFLWNTHLTAPKDAILVIYEEKLNSKGEIFDIDFNLIQSKIFAKDYVYVN